VVVSFGWLAFCGVVAYFSHMDRPRRVPRTAEELAALEARYRPFDPASAWTTFSCDTARWQRHADSLSDAVRRTDADSWTELRERFLRAAALDSSALAEMIRPVSDLTSVVLRGSLSQPEWVALVEANRMVVECQRRALVVAADTADTGAPIDENLVARLQYLICESQQTYTVSIDDGSRMEVELPRGQYKPVSNYLRSPVDGVGLVPFAPADRVADEMNRLCADLISDAYRQLHPVVQSAFAHFSLQCVHPFADGNGRLCRTVASIPLLREVGLPQLILADQWPAYLQALGMGHQGDLQPLIDLFCAVQVNAMALACDLLGTLDPAAEKVSIPITESAERTLLDLVLVTARASLGVPENDTRVRVTALDGNRVRVTKSENNDLLRADLHLTVASDAPDWLSVRAATGDTLELHASDVHPVPAEIAHLRVRAWLDRLLDRPGVTADPPRRHARALFVLGVPRSGTTVMGNYLGSHPDVLGLAEYAAFYVAHSLAPRYVTPLPGHQHPEFLAGLSALAEGHAADAAQDAGCSWYCDATPWNLEVAGALASSLPDAVFVLMLRHFAGTVLSLRQFGWAGRSWQDAATRWTALNAHIAQLPIERTIVVSYDVLTEEPVETLGAIHAALQSFGLDPDGFDARQFTASHAALVDKPRPTIADLIEGEVVFHPISSLDQDRWTPEIHQQVWPVVTEMHRALAERFPNVYVSPPRPAHVPEHQW
jgi:hypothetical protein